MELSYAQLEKVNPALNAVVQERKERALQEAKEKEIKQEELFSGVPILMKDISQAIKGEKITSGSKLFQSNIAKQDSHFVHRIRKSGVIFTGHTNTPEFGLKKYYRTRTLWSNKESLEQRLLFRGLKWWGSCSYCFWNCPNSRCK